MIKYIVQFLRNNYVGVVGLFLMVFVIYGGFNKIRIVYYLHKKKYEKVLIQLFLLNCFTFNTASNTVLPIKNNGCNL